MELQKAKEFVLKASRATYAAGDKAVKIVQPDKSTTITFSNGEYSYHDNYFGGEPYGGREVVFYKDKPIWMMVYYGWVKESWKASDVYKILIEALRMSTVDMPYRGPKLFEKNGWRYANDVEGEFARFSGVEKIYSCDSLVYQASYIGGVINK
jgi:hypothetical protein